ncbi:hypothetical protein [Novosphingobium sp.]|uniref:hypothetical protein n=1 Tax=Novosphingobium sp. TaxID=1874826 RepID=UPI002734C4FB|nr:hypothetical protein [Novosphingobium sp.]MDP3906314.1 hypothetical protein [Novosphingobium sp.]
MSMHFRDLAAHAATDGAISAEDILALRGAGWADGRMDPEEAESLFLANDALRNPGPDWCDFFVDALCEFVVNTVEPRGYVDQVMGDELVSRIDHDGRVESMAELELLVKVLERAVSVPDSLKAYALRQIEDTVLSGDGTTRAGALDSKGINDVECRLLGRMVFAAGGDRPAAASRAEAELLFRLKDATLYDVNAPEWEQLFVQGVGSYLLGFGGREPLSRERASDLEAFMNRPGAGIGGFLRRMLGSDVDLETSNGFSSLLSITPHTPDVADEADEAARLTGSEELWLLDHIDADEELDPLEKALLQFIAEETGDEPLRS